VTGHTGFKGAWLCEWLLSLGAEVTGLGLPSETRPALFDQLGLAARIRHMTGDIRDLDVVQRAVDVVQPDFLFHLAAQPLVRYSYAEPVATYATNVMGTVHVLEAIRKSGRSCVVVVVTTDKCYENREWLHGYREEDPMGGHDPYSSSKGAAELVVAAYRRSYFSDGDRACGRVADVRIASARAGNVIGGGDWAADRLVPDCIRSLLQGTAIPVRNKHATRPWQHVLEPLSGYLLLACRMATEPCGAGDRLCQAFNFGPPLASNRTAGDVVEEILRHWPGTWDDRGDQNAVHEAGRLNLATDRAFHLLSWRPVWDFAQTIERTVTWYRAASAPAAAIHEMVAAQIEEYLRDAETHGLAWTK
jgi:CDP-glucose 4,6-dehydratase